MLPSGQPSAKGGVSPPSLKFCPAELWSANSPQNPTVANPPHVGRISHGFAAPEAVDQNCGPTASSARFQFARLRAKRLRRRRPNSAQCFRSLCGQAGSGSRGCSRLHDRSSLPSSAEASACRTQPSAVRSPLPIRQPGAHTVACSVACDVDTAWEQIIAN